MALSPGQERRPRGQYQDAAADRLQYLQLRYNFESFSVCDFHLLLSPRLRFWSTLACAFALVGFPAARAAESESGKKTEQPPQVSEAVSTALQKVNQLITTENWDAALTAVNDVLKTVKPGSYDYALTQLHIAQIHLSRNKKDKHDYADAIPALEAVVKSGFWPKEKVTEWKYIIAQLCAQEDKVDQAEQYLREWLNETSAPTADAYVFYCSLLIGRAQKNPDKIDKALLETVLQETRKGLRIGAKPNDTLYYLQAACYQGLERWDDAAETLELLLKKNPRNKAYWSQLFAMYVTAGNDLRSALTIERAHQYDAMNTPKENIALAQLYHNMKQFDRAIEILEKGLNDGSIEPSKPHWEMLGYGYQQIHQEFKAIQTFIRADKTADNGYFLGLVGNAYYGLGKNPEAVKYFEMALKRGVENAGQISLFAAHLAFELKEYDRAAELLKITQKNIADDTQRKNYEGLREVVETVLRQQEEEKTAAAKKNPPGAPPR
jgi:tetratricopeptide (TPR) repeat protein